MQRLEVSCAVRPIYKSLGVKGLKQTVYIVTTPCVSPRLAPYAPIDYCYAMRVAEQ